MPLPATSTLIQGLVCTWWEWGEPGAWVSLVSTWRPECHRGPVSWQRRVAARFWDGSGHLTMSPAHCGWGIGEDDKTWDRCEMEVYCQKWIPPRQSINCHAASERGSGVGNVIRFTETLMSLAFPPQSNESKWSFLPFMTNSKSFDWSRS